MRSCESLYDIYRGITFEKICVSDPPQDPYRAEGARGVVYSKWLGETYLTLDRRVLLLLYLSSSAGIDQKPKKWAGKNSKLLRFSTPRKFLKKALKEKSWLLGVAITLTFCPYILVIRTNRISARQSRSMSRVRHYAETQYSDTGGSMALALLLLPVATTCGCWERATGQLP